LLQPLYRLLGSLLVGIGIAYGLKTMVNATASASQYQLALVIGAIVLTLGISQSLKLSLLFAPLILGITIRSIENRNLLSELELGATFELFFIVLFVFAGANLHIAEVFEFAPVIFSIVLVRCCAKLGVSTLLSASRLPGAAIGQQKMRQGFATGILLIPMAGLAIGLTQTTSLLFPVYASTLSAIVLGAVAVFETIGPPLAAYAFRLAGETGKIPSAHQHSQHGAETPGTE
jgi:hypothetical protein